MPDFITLTCPTCGAKLKLNNSLSLLVCASCGNEHMIHRDGGAIYLAPLAQDVRQIRIGTDKTAAELAVSRLTKELDALNVEFEELINRSDDQWVDSGPAKTTIALGGFFALIAVITLASGSWGLAIPCGAVAAFMLYDGFKSQAGRDEKINSLREEALAPIEDKLDKKEEQLRKSREILDS